MPVLHRSTCKHAEGNGEKECAVPSKTTHQCAEISHAFLQYPLLAPLNHPEKLHPRRFFCKMCENIGLFDVLWKFPSSQCSSLCLPFKVYSFPSFSSSTTKYQTPGILILIFPYYNYLL